VSLGLCLLIAPVSGRFTVNAGLIIPVLFLGLLISVVAQLLLYRLLSGKYRQCQPPLYLVPDHGAAGLSAAGQPAAGGGDGRYDGDRRRDRAGVPHREGPRRLMSEPGAAASGSFSCHLFTHAPGSLF
jgi:hypothetical protein